MDKIVLFEGEGTASQSAKIDEAYTLHKQLVIDESFLMTLKEFIEGNNLDDLHQTIDDLREELREKNEEYGKLENDLDEVAAERNELEEENDRLRDEVDDLREQLSEKDEW